MELPTLKELAGMGPRGGRNLSYGKAYAPGNFLKLKRGVERRILRHTVHTDVAKPTA